MIATPPKAEINPEPGKHTVLTIQYEPTVPEAKPPEVTAASFNMYVSRDQTFSVNNAILTRAEFWQMMKAEPVQPIALHGATIRLIPEG